MNDASTVLIVDDEPTIRDTIGRMPSHAGYALAYAEDGEKALFETVAQGVIYQDADGRITGANPAGERCRKMARPFPARHIRRCKPCGRAKRSASDHVDHVRAGQTS